MDPDAAAKLKEKAAQLKQANGVLKKACLEKQEANAQLEKQVKEKETTVRQQLEEIDQLQFQNTRQSKQLGMLTAQVEELQKQKQTGGWSMQGLISGKQQQEQVQKAENEIRVLRDELMMKIQENEDLHMRLFEADRQHKEEEEMLRNLGESVSSKLEQMSLELKAERDQTSALMDERQQLSKMLLETEDALAESNALVSSMRSRLKEERGRAEERIWHLETQLMRWVPFNGIKHEQWNLLNCNSYHGLAARRRTEVIEELRAAALEACEHSSGVFRLWAETFGGFRDGEPVMRAKIRQRLYDTAEALVVSTSEEVPTAISRLLAISDVPRSTAMEANLLRRPLGTFLSTHKKWVVYQCLLLLHDSSAFVHFDRTQQESELATTFVEGLWRLHRSLRKLFARVRLCTCMPALYTRSASSGHFCLSRRAFKQVGRAQWQSDLSGGTAEAVAGASSQSGGQKLKAGQSKLAASLLATGVGVALQDVSKSWEGVARCITLLTEAQGTVMQLFLAGRSAAELLGSVQKMCVCLTQRVGHVVDHAASMDSQSSAGSVHMDEGSGKAVANPYFHRLSLDLCQAPGSIGFMEATQTQLLARQLSATRARLSGQVREQLHELELVANNKNALAEELRALQDSHAILRHNFEYLQEAAKNGHPGAGDGALETETRPPAAAPILASDIVLSSRHRSVLEGVSVMPQEGESLKQRGFFVDALSLSPHEVALASGPPSIEALVPWELAVRKVYEHHMRNLQAQVRAADAKAAEFHLGVQDSKVLLTEQENGKHRLREDLVARESQLSSLKEDMATTQKNYDTQLAMLTEHICTLSSRLSEKDAGLASLQAYKVLCGHCGMWNTMGKLMGKEASGICQTCKEKVLSSG